MSQRVPLSDTSTYPSSSWGGLPDPTPSHDPIYAHHARTTALLPSSGIRITTRGERDLKGRNIPDCLA